MTGARPRPLSGGSTCRPRSSNGVGRPLSGSRPLSGVSGRQRAIYSEALIAADAISSRLEQRPKPPSTPRSMGGPSRHKQFLSAQESQQVSVNCFSQKASLSVAIGEPAKLHFADVDPKVCEAFKTVAGRPPRRVRVERLRRQFEAEDISDLLKARGIDYSDPTFEAENTLPLDPFDDTEFDVRTPAEWLELGRDLVTGEFKPLPAQALFFEAGAGFWRRALVQGYDSKLQQFEVRWDEGGLARRTGEMLPRLRVLFAAEDPIIFADRCKAAHDARCFAESMVKYNFYIDNMPTDDVQMLNSDQTERLLQSLQNPRKTGEEETEASDIDNVLQEIQLDFARTMNRIIFDVHLLERLDDDPMHKGLRLVAELSPVAPAVLHGIPGVELPGAPRYGLVPIPLHNFAETFASLCLSTLRVRPEVVLALHGIRGACLRIAKDESVFCTTFRKPLRLEEFRQMQRTAVSGASFQMKEAWCNSLNQIILREFASVGKGWFNINETSRDLYKRGKLIRFLALVRLIMQDTLREIAQTSVDAYLDAVESLTPLKTRVESLSQTMCTYKGNDKEQVAELGVVPTPLFSLEAFRKDGQDGNTFGLSTEPARFVVAAMEAFDSGLAALNDVQSLERLIVPHLSKMQSPQFLNGVDTKEAWVVQARAHLEERLSSACPALADFLLLLQQHEDLLRLDPNSYVKDFVERHTEDDARIQELIQATEKAQADLVASLPESAHVGLFQVGCKDLRRYLSQKHEQTVALLFEVLLKRLRDQMSATFAEFNSIANQLRKAPKSIEELIEIRHFVEGVPQQVDLLRHKIAKDIRVFDRLEDLRFNVPLEDVRNRWNLTAAPKVALEIMGKTLRELQRHEDHFTKQMLSDQADFWSTLDDIDQIIELFRRNPEYRRMDKHEEIKDIVENCSERIASAAQQATVFNSREALLEQECTDYGRLQETVLAFEPYSALWIAVSSWLTYRDGWRDGPLMKIDATHLESEVSAGANNLLRVCKFLMDDPAQEELYNIATQIHKELNDFVPHVPLIVALRTDGMNDRHWKEIATLVGHEISPDMPDFTLTTILGEPYLLQSHCLSVQEVADRAAKEYSIEIRLKTMRSDWEHVNFDCVPPPGNTGTYILKGIDVVGTLLDEQLVGIQSLQFSLFKGNLSDEIDAWSLKLRTMSDHLDEWIKCQKSWLYLQPIFDSADVMRQLPAESRRFKSVDSLWRSVMKLTNETPHALTCLSRDAVTERWMEANMTLEAVQRCLEEYLETKRAKFTRFYFLSNDELIEILSQTKDPTHVQPFLRKIYESMGHLAFQEDLSISAMASVEGEEIPFLEHVVARDSNVEFWMYDVEQAMFAAVRCVVSDALQEYDSKSRGDWIRNHPAQAIICSSQAHWAAEVEVALSGGPDSKRDPKVLCRSYLTHLEKQLQESIALIRSCSPKRLRDIACSLIVLDVHQKDIVDKLIAAGAPSMTTFDWLSQFRITWQMEEVIDRNIETRFKPGLNLWLNSMYARFPYGYEYLGNTSRLVITPLTDKCFTTLLGAQMLNMGGSLVGPAGTGKTETTKDLAKAVAKRCLVFNCSDGMNHVVLGRFFKGLAAGGSWCCFDEFNRITTEVLSVIAQQLHVLISAKAELTSWTETKAVEFEGSNIAIDRAFNVVVTMNPNCSGHKEVPDNLKALLRPIAMMVPDYTQIAEIMLYSFGFASARELARKVTTTFRLASEQLSSQQHYDYGLRAVRSVVDAAGIGRRALEAERAKTKDAKLVPSVLGKTIEHTASQESANHEEPALLLQALQDVNLPKLLQDDLFVFNDIIKDLFPQHSGIVVEKSALEERVAKICKRMSLQCTPSFQTKVTQLYRTMQVRHGLMLVGLPGGGKTCCYRVLHKTICDLADDNVQEFVVVKLHVLNPKAVTLGHLYGDFDVGSHDWRDGILAHTMRRCSRDGEDRGHWIMFDGPVDPEWIESINTVLDDNRKLCLNSSEVIRLNSKMLTMFEVSDLDNASPSTVSRCGMVHMDPAALGLAPIICSWIEDLPHTVDEHCVARIKLLCNDLLIPMIAFVRSSECTEVLPSSDVGLCASFLGLLQCQLQPFIGHSQERSDMLTFGQVSNKTDLPHHLDHLFLFSLVWSVGASCDSQSRKHFEVKLQQLACEVSLDVKIADANVGIHAYVYQQEIGQWKLWIETVPEFDIKQEFGDDARYEDIVVPTVDSIRTTALAKCLVTGRKHVLCPGPVGTGKSTVIKRLLCKDHLARHVSISMDLSAQTQAHVVQDVLEAKLEKRRRGVYGPSSGNRCIFFIDDLNMPRPEQFGAQPPLELLRQWFDHGGWYRRRELKFSQVLDILMIGALAPPGGGRQPLPKRLSRHYHCLALPELLETSMTSIFTLLSNHFCSGMTTTAQDIVPDLVLATLAVYNAVRHQLLPTPQKTHYAFNLRDVWRVFQGICSMGEDARSSREHFARAWCHENIRVFGDRFICHSDQQWLRSKVVEICGTTFCIASKDLSLKDRIIFSCINTLGGTTDGQSGPNDATCCPYVEVENLEAFIASVDSRVQQYNEEMPEPLLLSMFLDACDHVARICRVIRQPGGNCLLVGIGGSGRQSLARLASYCMRSNFFQTAVLEGYSLSDWRAHLKASLMKAGIERRSQSFLLCDKQVFNEEMIEDIDSVLNSGDILNLYTSEDSERIFQECTHLCHQMHLEPTKANIFSTYLQQVRRHMHIMLAFSPSSEKFRARLRMFPALVNCCTIDWFFEWPVDALISVAKRQLPFSDASEMERSTHDAIVALLPEIHLAACSTTGKFNLEFRRHCYVTPASYLELVALFRGVLEKKRADILREQWHFQNGVDKLVDAVQQVEVMKNRLVEMTPKLEATKQEVSVLMSHLEKDKAEADMTREWVAREEAEAKLKDAECRAKAEDAEQDLAKALPALDEAVDCLKKLKESQIREVKSMRQPPPGVELVMTVVCIMMSVKPARKPGTRAGERVDDYWEVVHTHLLKEPRKFLDDLLNYNKDNIADDIIRRISPYLEREEFEPAQIRKTSVACEAICLWVRAMVKYNEMSKSVEPKRLKLQAAQVLFEKANEQLRQAQDRLAGAVKTVDALEAKFAELVGRQDAIAQEIAECEAKIERAQRLTSGLSGERSRWANQVGRLRSQYSVLVGDVIYCAGMIAYSGVFDAAHRSILCREIFDKLQNKKVMHTVEAISLQKVLGDAVKLQEWHLCGLPDDAFSIESAIIMSASRRWPLMIDPQKQANMFIRNMARELKDRIDVTKQSDPSFLRILELAISQGISLLVESMGEEPTPLLERVLEQRKVKHNRDWVIQIGDTWVPWNPSFRLMMTTMIPNPHFSPELTSKVTVLNFVITTTGLEEQLLSLVVAKENPELQQKKDELATAGMRMRKELEEAEQFILRSLSSAEGNILLDEHLVDALASSKRTSEAVAEKMEQSNETEAEIDDARRAYSLVAAHSALLFTTITDLAKLDPMYQFSLQWFKDLFVVSIEEAPMNADVGQRIDQLKRQSTSRLFRSVARALFDTHKLLFAFSLCLKTMNAAGSLDVAECRFLLTGSAPQDDHLPHIDNPTEFLTSAEWNRVLALGRLHAFSGIEVAFDVMRGEWQKFYESFQPEEERLPGNWEHRLNRFQRLCLLRTIRMDCVMRGISAFIDAELGHEYVAPLALNLASCFHDATNATPLIFMLEGGADPVAEVRALAVEMKLEDQFDFISLGQGQGARAKKLVQEAAVLGSWVLLCNCHLSVSWMPELERLWEDLKPETVHRDFRLWLSSASCLEFPVVILQAGIKMTNAAPRGIRAKLLQTFSSMGEQEFDGGSKIPEIHRRLIFALCFFHAMVNERRRFGAIGWNVPYQFTPEDLSSSRTQLRSLLKAVDSGILSDVPYTAIRHLIAGVNYGGRITDDRDQRLMDAIVDRYFCKDLAEKKDPFLLASDAYVRPDCESKQDFIDYAAALPFADTPDIFGLHENARVMRQQQEANCLLANFLLLESASSFRITSSDSNVGGDARPLHKVRKVKEQIPATLDTSEIQSKHTSSYKESLNIVLCQEIARYNGLLQVMKETLERLENALQGLVVMSEDLEDISACILDGRVPQVWTAVGHLSLKPLKSWMKDLIDRINFFSDWMSKGRPPIVFWISGFFFPQGFLSNVLQNFARRNSMPIDRVCFRHQILSQHDPAEAQEVHHGCLTYGFYLEGCRFDDIHRRLDHSATRELFYKMPLVWFLPGSGKDRLSTVEKFYEAPVYKVESRSGPLSTTGHSTNYITSISLPTEQSAEVWILAGVALILSLST